MYKRQDVDAAGHSNGFSPEVAEYVEAAETAEKMTNNILAALDGRDQNNESWLIIITSDHGGGGMFLKMHHPSTLIDRNSFMLVSGESTRLGEMTNNPVITDVTATALTHLAIPLPEGEDKLDGRASPFEQNTSTVREASCAQPAFYYRVNLMIALVGSCFLSITAIAIFIIVRLRQQYQGSNVQQIATESDEESIPMSQSL